MIYRMATAGRPLLLFLAFVVFAAGAALAQSFALRDGQTVVFYGDSITAQRFYTREVEEFVLTRYPNLHIRFVNAGVPGDTAAGGYAGTMAERVARDVKPYQPAMITVMLGMNDGGWGYGVPAEIETSFQQRYAALLRALRLAAPGAELTLIAPTPYDEITHGTEFTGYSGTIDRIAQKVERIAAGMQAADAPAVLFADFHGPMLNALKDAKTHEAQIAPLLIPDRIHPAQAAHWIMAAALMKAWHVDPLVSSAALDASDATVLATERTEITGAQKTGGGIAWIQLDQALPLPLDWNDTMTLLLLCISDLAALDRQMLRVTSLQSGEYELSIDDKPIAVFSQGELERGVNLALYKTPMLSQARAIASMQDQRAELDEARFILSANLPQKPCSGLAEATLREAQDELATKQRKQLALQPHRYMLRPVHTPPSTSPAAGEGRENHPLSGRGSHS